MGLGGLGGRDCARPGENRTSSGAGGDRVLDRHAVGERVPQSQFLCRRRSGRHELVPMRDDGVLDPIGVGRAGAAIGLEIIDADLAGGDARVLMTASGRRVRASVREWRGCLPPRRRRGKEGTEGTQGERCGAGMSLFPAGWGVGSDQPSGTGVRVTGDGVPSLERAEVGTKVIYRVGHPSSILEFRAGIGVAHPGWPPIRCAVRAKAYRCEVPCCPGPSFLWQPQRPCKTGGLAPKALQNRQGLAKDLRGRKAAFQSMRSLW